jgi:hypothetical protein
MIIYDLRCASGHTFEGWFGGREACEREKKAGRLSCPLCGGTDVEVLPSGGHIGRSSPPAPAIPPGAPAPGARTLLAALARAVEENFEDVGDHFSEEALRIHEGEAKARNIRGSMTADEEKELLEEGVEFAKIPLPRFQG